MRRIAAKLAGAIAAAVALLVVGAPASADVPPGFDLFETDPSATVFSFREEFTIPPNFFDQGSAPFQGDVTFGGVPLNTFQNRDIGDTDTVVQRPQNAVLAPPFPAQTEIPLELVALNLQSVQPIQVDVRGTIQLWDVRAGLSQAQRSPGAMRIVQTEELGGAFDSALRVFPRFDFTRLSDGTTRTIDVGEMQLSQQSQQKLTLSASNVPWRAGCVPPALVVLGMNDGFCPNFEIQGRKPEVPAIERAALARHGVYPAQPRLEHFACYGIGRRARFRRPTVQLADQFGSTGARVGFAGALCAPAQKNQEPFENRRAHLTCFAIRRTDEFRTRTVAVRNQFGPAVLTVTAPDSLCAPSSKSPRPRRRPAPLPRELRIDHYTCYRVQPAVAAQPRSVRLRDQFRRARVRVLQPVVICAPASKNLARIDHPVRHLVCYRLRRARFRPRVVRVRNQFGVARVLAAARRSLCVPSVKVPL
jgi:hypothetical protein